MYYFNLGSKKRMTQESLEDRINNSSNCVILKDGDTIINIHSEEVEEVAGDVAYEHQLVI